MTHTTTSGEGKKKWQEHLDDSLTRFSIEELVERYKTKLTWSKVRKRSNGRRRADGTRPPLFPSGDLRRSHRVRRNMPKAYYQWVLSKLDK